MKTAIMWFRNDLRTQDNEALYRAGEHFDRVLPVYCMDPQKWEQTWFDMPKMGSRRMQFILESLGDLHQQLGGLGSGLHIAHGAAPEVLPRLCKELGAVQVIAHKEVGTEETAEEEAVKQALMGAAQLKLYWGSTLTHFNDLPFALADLPDVFTAFRKRVEKEAEVRNLFPRPERLPLPEVEIKLGAIPTLAELGLEEAPIDPRAAIAFKGGETEAWKRLRHYFDQTHKLAEYKHTRNGLLGIDYSSKFSAWLAHGCISPRSIGYEVEAFEKTVKKNQSTYWLVFELRWRDYFRFVTAKFGGDLFRPGGIRNERPVVHCDVARIHAWKEGQTGIPFVDANMIELKETGFMSNRGRQNVASFLVKDLQQDWRIGAAWFEHHLIDYDVASNWGNWAYVAGVGNDPREDRYFNMLTQAARYDGKGAYVRHWIPELAQVEAASIHTPWKLTDLQKSMYDLHGTPYAKAQYVPDKWKL